MSNITIDKEIFSFFAEFDEIFNQMDSDFNEYLDDDSRELYDKNKKIINFIKVKLSTADYDLIPESSLQNIRKNMKEILARFKIIINNEIAIEEKYSMLNNETYFNIILKETPYINSFDLEKSEQTSSIRESINSIKNSTRSIISNVNKKKEKLIDDFKKIETDIENTNIKIENQKNEIDKYLEELKLNVDKAQDDYEEKFKEILKENESEFNVLNKSLEDEKCEVIDSANKRINSYIREIEEYKKQAEKLLNIISNTSMASGYQKYADVERDRARNWNFLASGTFMLLICFLIYWVMQSQNNEISTTLLLIKSLATFAFILLGTYAAKEGSKHEKIERKYRRMELELQSINPYLAEIEDEERKDIIRDFTKKYFGNVDTDLIDDDKQTGISDIILAFLNRKAENNIKIGE